MSRHSFSPFYHLFPLPFSHFESNFRRFFDGTSLFSPPKLTFSLLHLVLPHASGTSSRDLTLYYRHTSLFAQREYFSDSGFPFLRPLPHLHISIDFLSALHPPSLFTTPPLSFSFLPTFPSPSPINTRTRTPTCITCARVHPHVRRFSFIAFTASPIPRNPLGTNALGVKGNEKKPSQNTQQSHNQNINTKYPISSTVNFI